jgi:hypothetical protein
MLSTRYNGVYDSNIWPRPARIEFHSRLVALPFQHRLEISFGYCENIRIDAGTPAQDHPGAASHAYIHAVAACDRFIAESGHEKEIAWLFAEDTQNSRKVIETSMNASKTPPL